MFLKIVLENHKIYEIYRAACLLCDVALSIGMFGTITTSSSEPFESSSLKMNVFFWLKLIVPFSLWTIFTFSHDSLWKRQWKTSKINNQWKLFCEQLNRVANYILSKINNFSFLARLNSSLGDQIKSSYYIILCDCELNCYGPNKEKCFKQKLVYQSYYCCVSWKLFFFYF